MLLVNYRQGIVKRTDSFIQVMPNEITVRFDDNTILTIAHRVKNYLISFNERLTVSNTTPTGWLYLDIDLETAAHSLGKTEIEPTHGLTFPVNPAIDHHHFNLTDNVMYVWDGSFWAERIRIFLGYFLNGLLHQYPLNSQTSLNVKNTSHKIIFDDTNRPIRRYFDESKFEFITEDESIILNPLLNFSITSMKGNYIAAEAIPAYTIVTLDADSQLIIAEPSTTPAIGIILRDVVPGENVRVIDRGLIRNDAWNWSEILAPLFVSSGGVITNNAPEIFSFQSIGQVIAANEIELRFQEQVLIDPTTDNGFNVYFDHSINKKIITNLVAETNVCGYQHIQMIESDSWVIYHNLDSKKVSAVVIINNELYVPSSITALDEAQVRIDFPIPVKGYANLVIITNSPCQI